MAFRKKNLRQTHGMGQQVTGRSPKRCSCWGSLLRHLRAVHFFHLTWNIGSLSLTFTQFTNHKTKSLCFMSPLPLQVVDLFHTLWQQWGTPWGLGMVSQSGCLKVEWDSCTVDQGEVVAAMAHDCRRMPKTQQSAKELHDTATWWLFTKRDKHSSIRPQPQGQFCLKKEFAEYKCAENMLAFQSLLLGDIYLIRVICFLKYVVLGLFCVSTKVC